MSGARSRERLPVLDGLRGIAVLMVLVAHFNGEVLLKQHYPVAGPLATKIAIAGVTGVDLFFVLSGFLITGILLDTKGGGRYFVPFYARRILRIVPPYYLALFVVLVVLPRLVAVDEAALRIAAGQGWLWAYLANLPGVLPTLDSSPLYKLGHFWTLAVEQHFYLVWPFVVLAAGERALKRVCLAWLGVSFAVVLVESALGSSAPAILHWSTLTHSGGLALGGWCAVAVREEGRAEALGRRARGGLALFGVLLAATALVPRRLLFDPASVLYPPATLFFGALLVVAVTAPATSGLRRALSGRLLREVGKVSYGVYILHGILRPVYERLFSREGLIAALGPPLFGIAAYTLAAIGCTLLLAEASWHLFEKHWLRVKRFFPYEA